MTLDQIESITKTYADSHGELAEKVQSLTDQIEALKRRHLPAIKRAVERAAEHKAALAAAVASTPALFAKPRTVIFHGIKVGLQKGKGGITFADADRVVQLIHKHYPEDEAGALLHVTEKPDKDALGKLPVAELKKLGCEIEDAGDAVVIKPAAGEVDKIVNALLKGATDEAQEEAAA